MTSTFPDLSAASESPGGLIRPPGFRAALFGDAAHGDARSATVEPDLLTHAGVPSDRAWLRQVHGPMVLEATEPGLAGEADALITMTPGLAVLVATADCVPIIVEGEGFAAVIHAGWRGTAAGVVEATLAELADRGLEAERAAIGPAIGPCCYEVGSEVVVELPDHESTTDWGTTSVDLIDAVATRLGDIPVWSAGRCTKTDERYNSHRRNGTAARQVAITWLPNS